MAQLLNPCPDIIDWHQQQRHLAQIYFGSTHFPISIELSQYSNVFKSDHQLPMRTKKSKKSTILTGYNNNSAE